METNGVARQRPVETRFWTLIYPPPHILFDAMARFVAAEYGDILVLFRDEDSAKNFAQNTGGTKLNVTYFTSPAHIRIALELAEEAGIRYVGIDYFPAHDGQPERGEVLPIRDVIETYGNTD
ncbi:MAG TPA: hypothetical protein VHR66_16735 [Gemmataceae bacterium]|jgi:hypothetical protein|nr:hypothetical protein [Gemmataceae bacterium]